MIPYGRQDISEADIQTVVDVLRSDFLTQGPVVKRFEQAMAMYCQAKNALAVNSATSALHLACLALGLSQDDWLWTSPITFVASANCARYCGAKVDFVDIDPKTGNMSVDALRQKLAIAEKENRLPKVVVPVHLSGQSCDMQAIHQLAQQYQFKTIEDASHAIGGKYQGKPIGGCQYSDITVFSFHPVKIITTGEGGLATTNQAQLANKMRLLSSHGVTRDTDLMTHESHGPWYYQQIDLGFNYRMTDIQAALGLSQLTRLDEFVSRRAALASNYHKQLANLPITRPMPGRGVDSSWHLYLIRLDLPAISASHRQVFEQLRAVGIGVNLHYIPVHLQPYYQAQGFAVGDFPEAEQYYREVISLPLYPGLALTDQLNVSTALKNAVAI